MKAAGRPLRFLAILLGGWTAIRIAILWPSIDTPADVIDAVIPRLAAAERPARPVAQGRPEHRLRTHVARSAGTRPLVRVDRGRRPPPSDQRRVAVAALALLRFGSGEEVSDMPAPAVGGSLPLAPRPPSAASRWSGSAWLVLRGGGAAGAAFGGSQLGGSQTGVRLAYTIDRAHRLALVGHVAAPLRGKGRDAAIGIEWQPIRAPVRLIAEQRVSIDGGKGGPTIGIVGGVGPAPIDRDLTIEAYGQAGAIARDGIETFADGALRIARPVAGWDDVRVDLGAGAWGAAQRGAARLDAGPSLSADLPLGKRAHVRLSLDWRQRLAGDARPGSGLVLSLGTDF